ncbi:MAG: DUF6868 family protein [Pseudoalteromonas spongiae]|uniref:DUF6868 family protein n=1 Tax=Pseudoalteromonas spongiae TaxID=298657 RepID=A0ABU8EPR6_9GAMM|nr:MULTISPECIES: hypothetical protein [Pseudoalteromonas]MEC8328806.1 hypothetical protein [Pseudomonadota bacterium]TMO83781.1 hypothetical protein CWC15_13875 [Pseudoalteromonas spongiae]
MSIDQITTFLGWATIANCLIVSVSMVIFLLFRSTIVSIHSQLFNVEHKALNVVYIQYFAFYKILIVFFNLVPYLSLKLIM